MTKQEVSILIFLAKKVAAMRYLKNVHLSQTKPITITMHHPQSRPLLSLLSFCARLVILAAGFSVISSSLLAAEEQTGKVGNPIVNNASLIPPYKPDAEVKMEGMSPDWVKTLIMAQFRIETATPEGTFASATKVLDHYAEMGVNGLWINPVYQRDPASKTTGFNGYGNYGPDTIDSALTGSTNIDESFNAVKAFVDEAHKRNIRVIFDIVTWGVPKGSPLEKKHEEWFMTDGVKGEMWGGWKFNWANPELKEWFVTAAVNFIRRTGADGFRCDLEPVISGYDVFAEVRKRLYEEGRKVIIITEFANERKNVYDFEQIGVGWEKEYAPEVPPSFFEVGDYFLRGNNIIDSIKTGKGMGKPALQDAGEGGKFRYYTFMLASHDSTYDAKATTLNGSRLRMGYQAVFAPFIPIWNIGEEWHIPYAESPFGKAIYYNKIDWAKLNEPYHRAFFEDVKKMIRIRRTYPEIFEDFPENHRDVDITKIEVAGNPLSSYMRSKGGKSIVVVPNNSATPQKFNVRLPIKLMGVAERDYQIKDLMNQDTPPILQPAASEVFSAEVQPDAVGVYLVE